MINCPCASLSKALTQKKADRLKRGFGGGQRCPGEELSAFQHKVFLIIYSTSPKAYEEMFRKLIHAEWLSPESK